MFFAIYEETSGRLVSTTTVAPARMTRAGLAVATLAVAPAPDRMWDEATRGYVARPAKADRDRLADLQADSDYQALEPANQARVLALLTRHYGDVREA